MRAGRGKGKRGKLPDQTDHLFLAQKMIRSNGSMACQPDQNPLDLFRRIGSPLFQYQLIQYFHELSGGFPFIQDGRNRPQREGLFSHVIDLESQTKEGFLMGPQGDRLTQGELEGHGKEKSNHRDPSLLRLPLEPLEKDPFVASVLIQKKNSLLVFENEIGSMNLTEKAKARPSFFLSLPIGPLSCHRGPSPLIP